jgi:hypothetical protein
VSYATLTSIRDIRKQLAELIQDIGFDENLYSSNDDDLEQEEQQQAKQDVHFASELSQLFADSSTVLSTDSASSIPNVAAVRRMKVLYAAICAGLYPNVVQIEHPETKYHQVLAGSVALPTDPRALRFWDGSNFAGSFKSRM